MRTIGVIGCGVVGAAVATGFKQRGLRVHMYDKYKTQYDELPQLFNSEAIFVCVPTPTVDGRQDITALEDVFELLLNNRYLGIVVVKSTVLPGTTEMLAKKYMLRRVVHNPEFLTAAKPLEDFMNQPAIIIGGPQDVAAEIGDIYFEAKFHSIRLCSSARVTEMAKYMHNLFLSIKVSFSNEMYDVCKHLNIDYNHVRYAALAMEGIGHGHTAVPGPDGKRGFGGMCFPKDTGAFLSWCTEQKLNASTLQGAVFTNYVVRRDGDE